MPHTTRPIPLNLQLWDKAPGKFVRATVRMPSGAVLGGAAVELSHVSAGFYCTDEVSFPLTAEFVSVFYEVFDDAAHTVPSQEHSEAFEVFPNLGITSGGVSYSAGLEDLIAVVEDVELPLVAVVEQVTSGV